jgi:hypothetical protein
VLWKAKMLEFITSLIVAILVWIEKRFDKGKKATDAPKDHDSLRRAGSRIRERMRTEDDTRS